MIYEKICIEIYFSSVFSNQIFIFMYIIRKLFDLLFPTGHLNSHVCQVYDRSSDIPTKFFILHIICHLTVKFLSSISPFSEIPYLVNFNLAENLPLMSEIFDLPELVLRLA